VRPLLARLRERKLVQWAVAYLAAAWLVLQAAELLGDLFQWEPTVGRVIAALLGVGFLAALVIAWFHGEKGEQRVGGIELAMFAVLCVIAAVAVAAARGGAGEDHADVRVAEHEGPGPAGAASTSVAVLPFANMSGDPSQEYFGDGITEEILNVLSRVPGLQVAARTSSFSFKGKDVPVDEIGRRLNVAHVLEGSVRRGADRVRITAQLIDARTGYHLWSESYDRELRDVLAVQDEIAAAIADALRLRIAPTRVQGARVVDPEAHDLYLRGRAAALTGTEEGLERALALFRQALEEDPRYAPAHVGVAWAYEWLADAYRPPLEMFTLAKNAALQAVVLDSTLAEAHAALGLAVANSEWDWNSAERSLERGVELNPTSVDALTLSGLFFCGSEWRGARARAHLERAIELDPLSAFQRFVRSYCRVLVRDYAGAVASHREMLELDPAFAYLFAPGGDAYREMGRLEEALAEYARAERASGFPQHGQAIALARAGRTAEAREILARLEALSRERYVAPELIAAVYANLGETERAFEWIDNGYRIRSSYLPYNHAHPEFDPIRSDPRFAALLRRMGISPEDGGLLTAEGAREGP